MSSAFERIAFAVRDANPNRNQSNIKRRSIKLLEEMGEVSEAFLNVTSSSNGKGKTWNDVREEIADVLIVVLDIAWTPMAESGKFITFSFSPDHVRSLFMTMHPIFDGEDILDLGKSLGKYLRFGSPDDLIDLIEAALVLNWAVMPDQADISELDFESQLEDEITRKLLKWSDNRAKMAVVTDDV